MLQAVRVELQAQLQELIAGPLAVEATDSTTEAPNAPEHGVPHQYRQDEF